VHLRYEISGAYALPDVHQAIDDGIVDLLSIMDHRPGWGQMSRERFLRNRRKHGLSEQDALADFERRFNEPVIPRQELERLVEHAHTCGIYVASHDDVGPEQVSAMNQLGINIAEFPLSLEGAREALRLGMGTIGGAANSLRGGSLSGNLCVNSAIDERCITALCSDYYPPALLHAPFQMERQGRLSLPEAINLVSLNPARLVGMADQTGSIEVGKLADFAVVEHRGDRPKVIQSWVGGRLVHQSSHRKLPATHPFPINAEPCDSL
jgi:alpha-D-ribose 1-methylphosphonate 5-triphosphate diphosphatase